MNLSKHLLGVAVLGLVTGCSLIHIPVDNVAPIKLSGEGAAAIATTTDDKGGFAATGSGSGITYDKDVPTVGRVGGMSSATATAAVLLPAPSLMGVRPLATGTLELQNFSVRAVFFKDTEPPNCTGPGSVAVLTNLSFPATTLDATGAAQLLLVVKDPNLSGLVNTFNLYLEKVRDPAGGWSVKGCTSGVALLNGKPAPRDTVITLSNLKLAVEGLYASP